LFGDLMEKLQLAAVAVTFLAIASGMAFYERARIRATRLIFGKSQAIVIYWCAYLSLFVLGLTVATAAVVR